MNGPFRVFAFKYNALGYKQILKVQFEGEEGMKGRREKTLAREQTKKQKEEKRRGERKGCERRVNERK